DSGKSSDSHLFCLTILIHYLKRPTQRGMVPKALVINASSPTPSHCNRRSSTPLHNNEADDLCQLSQLEESSDEVLEESYTQVSRKQASRGSVRKRQGESVYNINNIVIPLSLAKVEKLQYKDILTPRWRVVSTQSLMDSEAEKEEDKAEGQVEDLSEETFAQRHLALEQREKLRWSSWGKRKCVRRPTRSGSRLSGGGGGMCTSGEESSVEWSGAQLDTDDSQAQRSGWCYEQEAPLSQMGGPHYRNYQQKAQLHCGGASSTVIMVTVSCGASPCPTEQELRWKTLRRTARLNEQCCGMSLTKSQLINRSRNQISDIVQSAFTVNSPGRGVISVRQNCSRSPHVAAHTVGELLIGGLKGQKQRMRRQKERPHPLPTLPLLLASTSMADSRQPEDGAPQWDPSGGQEPTGTHGANGYSASAYRTCQPGGAHMATASYSARENGFNGELTGAHAITAVEDTTNLPPSPPPSPAAEHFGPLEQDVGDEEEAGPLRRFQNSRERCKFLAPSISVSVPEDDPYHSDEEYYEHPLFSPEWTHSGSRPTGQAVAFRQIEEETMEALTAEYEEEVEEEEEEESAEAGESEAALDEQQWSGEEPELDSPQAESLEQAEAIDESPDLDLEQAEAVSAAAESAMDREEEEAEGEESPETVGDSMQHFSVIASNVLLKFPL
ncbi:hypothetical protein INR49_005956, partial [Caranx melampygus]